MTIYENVIEICLNPTFDDASRRDDIAQRELDSVHDRYFRPVKGEREGSTSQERALISLFWERASHEHKVARENGYVGSYHNCVLSLLYGIFGADIVCFLFDKVWVPNTTVDPFRPKLFLRRLSILERSALRLKDGAKTPVPLPETAPYIRPGMGPRLKWFSEEEHRLLLDYSLRELRDFGELGLALQNRNEKPSVSIQMFSSYDHGPEIMRFASQENKSQD